MFRESAAGARQRAAFSHIESVVPLKSLVAPDSSWSLRCSFRHPDHICFQFDPPPPLISLIWMPTPA
ncbi:hypothetical protein PAMP_019246 [Pampus punctatissimus]